MRSKIIAMCTSAGVLVGLVMMVSANGATPKKDPADAAVLAPAELSTSASYSPDLAPADIPAGTVTGAVVPSATNSAASKLATVTAAVVKAAVTSSVAPVKISANASTGVTALDVGTASGTGPAYGGDGNCVHAQLSEFQDYYRDLQSYFDDLIVEGQNGPATAVAYRRLQSDFQGNQVSVISACGSAAGGGTRRI